MNKYLGVSQTRALEIIKQGNIKDLQYFIMCYYPYVKEKAQELAINKDIEEELIQIGMEVVTISLNKLKGNCKCTMTTYVQTKVLDAMKKVLNDKTNLSLDTFNDMPFYDNSLDKVIDEETIREIQEFLETIDERRRYVFCSYLGIFHYPRKTLNVLAAELGISSQRVDIIYSVTLSKVKTFILNDRAR